jgi:hypothetical protein
MKDASAPDARSALIGAFLLGVLVAGIPFWRIPYSALTVPDAFYGIGVVVVFVVAAVLAYRYGALKGLLCATLVLPAVLMARVIVEGVLDPTRHNLWPLALVIALVLGFAVAGAGAACGWLASRLLRRG